MPDVFYAGQKDYIAKLNTLALAGDVTAAVIATDASEAAALASQTAAAASEAVALAQAAIATTGANTATSASAAANVSATNAAAATGAILWISGTTYAAGFTVYSALTFRTYRRKVAGAGTTDPSLDATNWAAITLDIVTGLPKSRPSLLLDFANSKTVDPRITFTRASTATYTDALGILRTAAVDAPRIDYDPLTGECKGLLIEEARTNLLTYSEDFDNAVWTKTRATITASAVTAPDGTMTADKLVEDTSVSLSHSSGRSIAVTAGVTYCISIYLKAAGRSSAYIQLNDPLPSYPVALFNLSSGVIGNGSTAFISTSFADVGSGWTRCSVTWLALASGTALLTIGASTGTTLNSNVYTGNGTSGIYVWGAQLEAGSFPASYIPTVASQVTRAADNASMTGANFSSWFNSASGTFYADSNAISGANVLTAGSASITSTISAQQKYTSSYAAANAATSLSIGKGTHAKIAYHPRELTEAVKAALRT